MEERFFIQIGKALTQNDQAIKVIGKAVLSCRRSVGILAVAGAIMVLTNISRDKDILTLKNRVKALENAADDKENDDFDFLK